MDKELPVSAWPEWKIIEKIGEGSFGKVYYNTKSSFFVFFSFFGNGIFRKIKENYLAGKICRHR